MTETTDAVRGTVAPGFEAVRQALEGFAAADPTYAAQVAALHRGRPVVDLACGPWADDALVPIFSSTKGSIGVVAALLVERGQLDLDAPVATYWPEFAAAGKAAVTVRQLLSHQAGLPTVDGGFTGDELLAHDPLATRLAAQRPFWHPGAAFGYHGVTIGTLGDELVRRITGRTLAEVFRTEVAEPRGIDVHVGTPADLDARVVDVDLPTPEELAAGFADVPLPDPGSLGALSAPVTTTPIWDWVNDVAPRRVGPPAAGGLATARGLARLYAAVGHDLDGVARLVGDDTIAQVAQLQAQGIDVLSGQPMRFAVVFMKPVAPRLRFGSDRSFGHDGLGGALAFADPAHDVAFGYTVKRIALPGGADARAIALAAAVRTATATSP